jgi:hypothetical protein
MTTRLRLAQGKAPSLEGRVSTMILWDVQGHDGPANRAQERVVDLRGQPAISLAPFGLIGSGTFPSCYDAAIEEHSNGPVPGESSLEMLVEMRAIACDDDELLNYS